MIILIGNQKGGCGKSTTAVNLSALLVNKGFDVCLVDADRQSTASNWAQDRSENEELKSVHCVQKYENIRDTLLDLKKRYEFIIVDAAGRDSRELRTGMTAADVLLVPFRPSQPDLDVLAHLNDVITQARDLNPKLQVFGVLTLVPTHHMINEDEEAREYLKDYPSVQLLDAFISERKVYRDAMSEGMGVVEMENEKATLEVERLLENLIERHNGIADRVARDKSSAQEVEHA